MIRGFPKAFGIGEIVGLEQVLARGGGRQRKVVPFHDLSTGRREELRKVPVFGVVVVPRVDLGDFFGIRNVWKGANDTLVCLVPHHHVIVVVHVEMAVTVLTIMLLIIMVMFVTSAIVAVHSVHVHTVNVVNGIGPFHGMKRGNIVGRVPKDGDGHGLRVKGWWCVCCRGGRDF